MQSPADKRRQKALEQARHDLQAHLLAHIAAREHARETRDLATVAALRRAVRMWEDMHDTQKGGLITAGVRGGGSKGERAAGVFSENDLLARRLVGAIVGGVLPDKETEAEAKRVADHELDARVDSVFRVARLKRAFDLAKSHALKY